MVGHYWLRDARLAPTEELRRDIEETNGRIKQFVSDVHGLCLRYMIGRLASMARS